MITGAFGAALESLSGFGPLVAKERTECQPGASFSIEASEDAWLSSPKIVYSSKPKKTKIVCFTPEITMDLSLFEVYLTMYSRDDHFYWRGTSSPTSTSPPSSLMTTGTQLFHLILLVLSMLTEVNKMFNSNHNLKPGIRCEQYK